jgi:hypothetical protein
VISVPVVIEIKVDEPDLDITHPLDNTSWLAYNQFKVTDL